MIATTRKRRGWTLIELVGVVAMMSLLMGVAMSVLHSLTAWSQRTTAVSTRAAAVDRFEQRLRKQFDEATAVAVEEKTLRITLASGAVATWTLVKTTCELSITGGESPEFDRFDIGSYEAWQWTASDGLGELRLDALGGSSRYPFSLTLPYQEPTP